MSELEAILDEVSIQQGRLAVEGHEKSNEARCFEVTILTLYDNLQRLNDLSYILMLALLSLLDSWLDLHLMLLRLLLSKNLWKAACARLLLGFEVGFLCNYLPLNLEQIHDFPYSILIHAPITLLLGVSFNSYNRAILLLVILD